MLLSWQHCISISPTTGWATGQTENTRCVNRALKKLVPLKWICVINTLTLTAHNIYIYIMCVYWCTDISLVCRWNIEIQTVSLFHPEASSSLPWHLTYVFTWRGAGEKPEGYRQMRPKTFPASNYSGNSQQMLQEIRESLRNLSRPPDALSKPTWVLGRDRRMIPDNKGAATTPETPTITEHCRRSAGHSCHLLMKQPPVDTLQISTDTCCKSCRMLALMR